MCEGLCLQQSCCCSPMCLSVGVVLLFSGRHSHAAPPPGAATSPIVSAAVCHVLSLGCWLLCLTSGGGCASQSVLFRCIWHHTSLAVSVSCCCQGCEPLLQQQLPMCGVHPMSSRFALCSEQGWQRLPACVANLLAPVCI